MQATFSPVLSFRSCWFPNSSLDFNGLHAAGEEWFEYVRLSFYSMRKSWGFSEGNPELYGENISTANVLPESWLTHCPLGCVLCWHESKRRPQRCGQCPERTLKSFAVRSKHAARGGKNYPKTEHLKSTKRQRRQHLHEILNSMDLGFLRMYFPVEKVYSFFIWA